MWGQSTGVQGAVTVVLIREFLKSTRGFKPSSLTRSYSLDTLSSSALCWRLSERTTSSEPWLSRLRQRRGEPDWSETRSLLFSTNSKLTGSRGFLWPCHSEAGKLWWEEKKKKNQMRWEREGDYGCGVNSLGRTWPGTVSFNQLKIPSSLYNGRIKCFLCLNILNFLKAKNSVCLSVNSCWCSRTSQPLTPNNWDYCEIWQCCFVLLISFNNLFLQSSSLVHLCSYFSFCIYWLVFVVFLTLCYCCCNCIFMAVYALCNYVNKGAIQITFIIIIIVQDISAEDFIPLIPTAGPSFRAPAFLLLWNFLYLCFRRQATM